MAWSCYFRWRPCHDHAIFHGDHDMVLPWSYHGEYESPWSYHVIAWSSCLTMAVKQSSFFQKNMENMMIIPWSCYESWRPCQETWPPLPSSWLNHDHVSPWSWYGIHVFWTPKSCVGVQEGLIIRTIIVAARARKSTKFWSFFLITQSVHQ